MATTAAAGKPAELAAARPYAPSWLHALHSAIAALPGPAWLAFVGVGLLVGLFTQVQFTENGTNQPNTLYIPSLYWAFMGGSILWSVGAFQRLAERAFDAFRPALVADEPSAAKLRYELAVIPAQGSAVLLVGSALVTAAAFVLAPEDAGVVGLSPPILVGAFLTQALAGGVMFTLAYQLLRQMRLIRGALADASVDLFRPGPLQALSRITARTGLGLVVIIGSSVLVLPPPPDLTSLLVNWAPFLVVPPAIAAIAFLVPLSGMHERLEDEKARLLGEAEDRLRLVLDDLNHDVDAKDLSRADGLSKQLASMVQQRDLIAKLPTWPWSSGTFRAFVTAILLPLFLFIIQRLLTQVV